MDNQSVNSYDMAMKNMDKISTTGNYTLITVYIRSLLLFIIALKLQVPILIMYIHVL